MAAATAAVQAPGVVGAQPACEVTITFGKGKFKVILLDIEGTTTSIDSVKGKDGLFEYAIAHAPSFIRAHQHDEKIKGLMAEILPMSAHLEFAINTAIAWMRQDRKDKCLKDLQWEIWKAGYADGTLKGHVYKDAKEQMEAWKKLGYEICIYSSGSIEAQKALFKNTRDYGDLSHLISGYYDKSIGDKTNPESYKKIAQDRGIHPSEILFLTDLPAEVKAAIEAEVFTIALDRDNLLGDFYIDASRINNFNQIVFKG